MLAIDGTKLRWWGMDMRPRWRRRTLVLVTYLGMYVVIWSIPKYTAHTLWGYGAMLVAVLLLIQASVLRENGLVKQFPDLDEREEKEQDNAERWTLRQFLILLTAYAVTFADKAARHETIDAMRQATTFSWLVVLALTLPRARILWTEPDPRNIPGELGLARQAST